MTNTSPFIANKRISKYGRFRTIFVAFYSPGARVYYAAGPEIKLRSPFKVSAGHRVPMVGGTNAFSYSVDFWRKRASIP